MVVYIDLNSLAGPAKATSEVDLLRTGLSGDISDMFVRTNGESDSGIGGFSTVSVALALVALALIAFAAVSFLIIRRKR